MFEKGTIWAYPTDTSFGFGVRCDDAETLQRLYDLKERLPGKFFSLMVNDEAMLWEYAERPNLTTEQLDSNLLSCQAAKLPSLSWPNWFKEKPRTAILKPSDKLPKTKFWPQDKVAFRICTLPHVAKHIEVPITATSVNKSGQNSIFSINDIYEEFRDQVCIDKTFEKLSTVNPSEIWDFAGTDIIRIR